MAMLISKFHRLIQSRALWAAFLVIVVVSFVFWGSRMPSTAKEDARNAAGTVNGKTVSPQEFASAYRHSQLAIMMAMGREFRVTPEIDLELRRAAWYRLATLDVARHLGLTASRAEIANAIQSNPAFAGDNGQFHKGGYKAFVQQFLYPRGFDERGFEAHVAEEIMIQKVRFLIARSVLVAPSDARRTFSSISDRFKIEHAVLEPELVTNLVKVTEQDARAYYDKDPKFFEQPEKVKVKFVRFEVSKFIKAAKVEPDQIQAYYDQHMQDYLRPTNEVAATTNALGTNALFASRFKPFEEVKQEIANKLIVVQARDDAADFAMTNFVLKLARDAEGKAQTFEQAAAALTLKIERAGPIAPYETVKDVDAGAEFSRAASALTADEDGYVSDVIRGKDYVYVAALEERVPKRVPPFEEIKGEVMPLAQAQAISDALGNKAKEIHDAAAKAVKSGQSFASALALFKVPVITSEFFTASTGPTTNNYAPLLMRGVMTLNQGEVSEILPAADAILLAHVVQRLPGDPTTYDTVKEQIESRLRREYARLVFDGWQSALLQRPGTEAKNLKKAVVEPDEAEASAEEPAPAKS